MFSFTILSTQQTTTSTCYARDELIELDGQMLTGTAGKVDTPRATLNMFRYDGDYTKSVAAERGGETSAGSDTAGREAGGVSGGADAGAGARAGARAYAGVRAVRQRPSSHLPRAHGRWRGAVPERDRRSRAVRSRRGGRAGCVGVQAGRPCGDLPHRGLWAVRQLPQGLHDQLRVPSAPSRRVRMAARWRPRAVSTC